MILVTGYNGQLGYEISKILSSNNVEHASIGKDDLDFTNLENIKEFLENKEFDVIINCAAYTAVDNAELNETLVNKINHLASNEFANYCSEHNSKYVIISTDYVFDGNKIGTYDIDDIKNPLNVYGKSKDLAENDALTINKKTFIVRTSWVFGINGNNFVKKMIELSKNHNVLSVVNDQIGSPTYALDLAEFICELIKSEKYGIYHATNENYCSWYEFAKEIFKQLNLDIAVNPVDSNHFKTLAKRPLNSRLNKQCLIDNEFKLFPTWQDALKRFLKLLNEDKIVKDGNKEWKE